jgi:exodeoxyribonuclease VII large subunit
LATPDQGELMASVRALRSRLTLSARRQLADLRRELVELTMALRAASPRAQLANARQWLDELARLTGLTVRHELALRRAAVEGMRQALEAVSPQAVLSRGYAIVTDPVTGSIVRSARQVQPGDRLDIRLGDGTIAAKVEEG